MRFRATFWLTFLFLLVFASQLGIVGIAIVAGIVYYCLTDE